MEAPTSVSALLHSATMVKAGVYLIARLICLFGPISSLIPMWLTSTMWIGAVTAFIGAILALSTTDIKGVAAYSTISQIGFMFAALGTATSTASLGWFASILHLISHALFQALDFFLIGGIIHVTRTRDMRLMGGLRKAMPTTFAFSIVVLLMRAGIPPFVSFFSKELIFQSVLSSGNLYAALLLYVSTAATFAYTLRAITLIYGGEESAYLKQLHLHEAPKIMLLSSGVLAALCIFTAPLGNLFPHLMHINMKMDLSEVLNPLISIFLLTLIAGGLPIYFAYYREVKMGRNIGQIFVLNKILENGFFFDIFYERKIAQGVLACSSVLRHIEKEVFGRLPHILASKITACSSVLRHIEKEVFGRLPHILASKITALAYGVQRYFDALLDRLLYVGVSKTLTSTSKIRRGEPKSMKHYIAAILIGFLLIFILTIIILH
jgi:NADH:ubiquinone oxidoreductase subunit 5 (subunit L)/multisubunit Na+/H+ antiporter MnhA subunit